MWHQGGGATTRAHWYAVDACPDHRSQLAESPCQVQLGEKLVTAEATSPTGPCLRMWVADRFCPLAAKSAAQWQPMVDAELRQVDRVTAPT